MSTKYELVRDTASGRVRYPHQDPTGYPSATEASLYALKMDLDASWYIQPVAPDAQPARMRGIA